MQELLLSWVDSHTGEYLILVLYTCFDFLFDIRRNQSDELTSEEGDDQEAERRAVEEDEGRTDEELDVDLQPLHNTSTRQIAVSLRDTTPRSVNESGTQDYTMTHDSNSPIRNASMQQTALPLRDATPRSVGESETQDYTMTHDEFSPISSFRSSNSPRSPPNVQPTLFDDVATTPPNVQHTLFDDDLDSMAGEFNFPTRYVSREAQNVNATAPKTAFAFANLYLFFHILLIFF